MNAHQLDANGVIINTIVVNDLDVFPNLVDASIGGNIGDSIINGVVIPKQTAVEVPESVPMLNARLVLIQQGLNVAVQSFFETMEGAEGHSARAYWDYAQNVRRDNVWVEQARNALGLTNQQIDELFIAAKSIEA